jgi:hypothetical protein
MKKSLSLSVQAVYVLITALQLIFVPNMLLGMFGFEPTSEVWIKVLGIILLSLVVVYYAIIQSGDKNILKMTIYSRLLVVLGFILLVATGQAATPLILFAGIDLATAKWTWFEIKRV